MGVETVTDAMSLAEAIIEFETELPGWWWSVASCSVSRDASCAPDRTGPDADLLELHEFDDGFHADLRDGTAAEALRTVMAEAKEARALYRAKATAFLPLAEEVGS